ncbi:MAG TPA: AgmX/PglI C-terminal domain-containing protein [Polyangia bacterium]|nr:AgmX/PglI C-terminal domain-containing protein [Polyangia bacterium]
MSALMCVALLAAAATATPETKRIDAQCKAATKLDEEHRLRFRMFADVSDAVLPAANDGSGSWRAVTKHDDPKAASPTGNAPNTVASLWSASDGTTIAQVYFQSDSGDWSQDVEYCFRADGTLARLTGALSNYAADVEGARTIHYAPTGDVLSKTGKARALESHKPLPTLDNLDTPPVYPTRASLPFLAPKSRAPAAPPRPPATPRPRPVLDTKAVDDSVNAHAGDVKRCYDRARPAHPGLAGRLDMHWTIGGDGATRNVTVEKDALHADVVTSCIAALISTWRFTPAPDAAVEISFPFVFRPAP